MKKVNLIFSLIFSICGNLLAQWPQYGRDPGNTNLAPFSLNLGNAPMDYQIRIAEDNGANGPYLSTPVIANGLVFVSTGRGLVAAVSVNTKSKLWEKAGRGSVHSPVVYADVLVSTDGQNLYAQNVYTGDLIWQEFLPGVVYHDLLIDGSGIVYVSTENGWNAAYDVYAGTNLWTADQSMVDNSSLVGQPAVTDNGNLVVSSVPEVNSRVTSLYALRISDGGFAWRKTFPLSVVHEGNVVTGILAANDMVYFTNQPRLRGSTVTESILGGVNELTRQEYQQDSGVYQYHSRLSLMANRTELLYGSGDSFFPGLITYNAIDGSDESSLSNIMGQLFAKASAISANGDIVLGTEGGSLSVLSPSGTVKFTRTFRQGTHRHGIGAPALAPKFVSAVHSQWWGVLYIIAAQELSQYPEVRRQPQNLTIEVPQHFTLDFQGSPTIVLDPDGDPLTYSGESSDSNVASVTFIGSVMTLTALSKGQARIFVEVEDINSGSVATTFLVDVVEKENGAPIVSSPIQDQQLKIGGTAFTRDLNAPPQVFVDPESDPLSFSSLSSNPMVVSATLEGSLLTATPLTLGSSMVTVRADDGRGGSAETTFEVEVSEDSNEPEGRLALITDGNPAPGEPFWVSLEAQSVDDLFGISPTVSYETEQLDVVIPTSTSVLPGSFFDNPLFFPNVDETAGLVEMGISQRQGDMGRSGSGIIARIQFTSSSETPPGTTTTLQFDQIVANDPEGNPIQIEGKELILKFVQSVIMIWPGDTDNNGSVSASDVLPIGLYYDERGSARGGSCSWKGQSGALWDIEAATYADANGNGVVQASDVLCIGINYGNNHAVGKKTITETLSEASDSLSIIITHGEAFWLDVNVSNAENVLGIAFNVLYNSEHLDVGMPTDSNVLPGAFFDDPIFFPNVDEQNGFIDVGITHRQAQGGKSGSDTVLRIQFVPSPSITDGTETTFYLTNVVANAPDGGKVFPEFDLMVEGTPTIVQSESNVPGTVQLSQNYPNPFNPSTTIRFSLPTHSNVSLVLFDMTGRKVLTLLEETLAAGFHEVNFEPKTLAGGLYFYRLISGDVVRTKKLILLK